MSINLKRLVSIDIRQHIETRLTGTRDEVVLYTSEGVKGTETTLSSLSEARIKCGVTATVPNGTMPISWNYCKVFFNNAGAKIRLIEGVTTSDLTKANVTKLDNKYICICYAASTANTDTVYSALSTLATSMEPIVNNPTVSDIYGINEKIIIARTKDSTKTDSIANFAVKYSSIEGGEMTIAAYLSRINVYGIDTVYDYMFTQEEVTEETVDDTLYNTLITNNYNVDIKLGGVVRNCGGNCKNGADLVNNYVRIILHQTLTDKLVDVLSQKLKDSSGISKIYNTIVQELENYLTCGYLTRDKVWTYDDLKVVDTTGTSYTIISKGTALVNGYVIKVLPLTSLTEQDKAERKAPAIYVILADQYGIRQITINGEII